MQMISYFKLLLHFFVLFQGNSNSLASIDVAAGYVGLLDYQPALVGIFLMAHTYSAPVLSQLMLVSSLIQHHR
jgi:ethanolaminephosphotransferase